MNSYWGVFIDIIGLVPLSEKVYGLFFSVPNKINCKITKSSITEFAKLFLKSIFSTIAYPLCIVVLLLWIVYYVTLILIWGVFWIFLIAFSPILMLFVLMIRGKNGVKIVWKWMIADIKDLIFLINW